MGGAFPLRADPRPRWGSLGQVARAVNTSTFYFCKMFKKATGLNFTEYLSRVRIEKAETLLLNPNLRVSEIAYDVGFQSLTHFNRVFRKVVGLSPTGSNSRGPEPLLPQRSGPATVDFTSPSDRRERRTSPAFTAATERSGRPSAPNVME
jgi:AraC-like DNA-binding protein